MNGKIIVFIELAERSLDFNLTDLLRYRQAPTKAEIVNKFSALQINSDLTLYIKPSRPIAKVGQWTQSDEENCFRIEVLCE